MRLRPVDRLYLIADSAGARRPIDRAVAEAVQAGVRLVQLREKQLPDAQFLALAQELRRITAAHDARLLINSRTHMAQAVGADGVHLPGAASIAEARRLLGPQALIGYSAHNADELRRAEQEGADFVTLSPVFPPHSKSSPVPALGLERFAQLVRSTCLPVYALGGVDPQNARDCLAAGAFGIAVVGALMSAPDIPAVVSRFLELLGE
jgi:thiamine-phosphate pyrophosphorylase